MAVPRAGWPLGAPGSWSHGFGAAKQRGSSGRGKATAPSHGHSWGKIPSIPCLHSLQKLKEEGGSAASPPKEGHSPRAHAPAMSNLSPPLSTACPAPSSQAQLPRQATAHPPWQPGPGVFLSRRRHRRLEGRAASSSSSSQQAQKHVLLAPADRSGVGGQEQLPLQKGTSLLSWRKRETGPPRRPQPIPPPCPPQLHRLQASQRWPCLPPRYSDKVKVTWSVPTKQTNTAALSNFSFAFVYFAAWRLDAPLASPTWHGIQLTERCRCVRSRWKTPSMA